MITISKHSKEGRHAPITLLHSTRALRITSAAAWPSAHCASSVLVERFLPLRFNKLPYVSICSTTREWELTFQSAGPCVLWMHWPQIFTWTPFITLNDWLTKWRPSVITPKQPPCCFPLLYPLLLTSPPFLSNKLNPVEFLLHLWLLSPVGSAGTCPFQSQKQQTRLSCRGGQQTSLLGGLKMLKADLGCVVAVCGRLPVASSFQFQAFFKNQRFGEEVVLCVNITPCILKYFLVIVWNYLLLNRIFYVGK